MPTMVYNPGIKVYIATENDGTLDLSDDLVDGTMVRRSDGVSTFNFSIQNTRRKYDGKFTPNDRIVVLMKRLTWVQTFSGYLNSVPLMSAWPKVISVAASCSLKRLQYWFWDPYSTAAYNMVVESLVTGNTDDPTNTDGGLTNLIKNVLDKVVGWPEGKIHIGRIPADWFKIAEKVATQVGKESKDSRSKFLNTIGMLGGETEYGGAKTYAGDIKAGTYGGRSLDRGQIDIAIQIWNVAARMDGITERDIVTAFSVAGAESSFHNYKVAVDHDSVGVFQQRPSSGWGTVAECTDVEYATTAFLRALRSVENRDKMTTWMAGQTVQRSAFDDGSNYREWTATAKALVEKMRQDVSSLPDRQQGGVTQTVGVATGDALVSWAIDLVQTHRNIPYIFGATPRMDKVPPYGLDCSMLVGYVYYHVLGGKLLGGTARPVVSSIDPLCKRITVDEAMVTPGAVLIKKAEHIGISMGNDRDEVATNTTSAPARIKVADRDWYDYGGLLPGISYDRVGSATAGGARTDNQGYGVDTYGSSYAYSAAAGSDTAPGAEDDIFNTIFGKAGFTPAPPDSEAMAFSQALIGVRALLNDQPLLGGFLKNAINSSLRSFCSAPNGDFIAWFPDYYGLWGTAAKMVVEPIEVQDFTVDWTDDFFVTHQFTVLGFQNMLDPSTGAASVVFSAPTEGGGGGPNALAWETFGIANIDVPAIMEVLFGVEPTKEESEAFTDFIYRKFGARPDYQVIDGIIHSNDKRAEFFSALYLFMRQWAYQYNAQVPLTFMPELWPGMLLQIPKFDFQGYVTTVTHTFSFGDGGGFNTQVNLAAPARMPKGEGGNAKGANANVLIGLPLAGGYTPGISPDEARRILRPAIEPDPVTPPGRQLPGSDAV